MRENRDEPGRRVVRAGPAPSLAVVGALALVVIAAVAFFVSGRPDKEHQVARPVAATTTAPTVVPTRTPTPTSTPKRHKVESVPRAYVEIFNNSAVAGLADATSSRVQGAGWKVVGVDNWYGNIPATTVYYPSRLRAQAQLLAKELHVSRVKPAISPMKFDRLTLILTSSL